MNEIQDRLNRGANVAMARRYGVTAQGLENAKNTMQRTQAAADKANALYNEAVERGDSEENIRNLYKDKVAAETAAAKAKSKYDEGKKFADTHRVSPTFEEEHRPSLRERIRQAHLPGRPGASESPGHRPDMLVQDSDGNILDREGAITYRRVLDDNGVSKYIDAATGVDVSTSVSTGPGDSDYRYEYEFDESKVVFNPGTAHQDIPSRVTGTREKWNDDRYHRTDNRWDPNSGKDVANENETGFTQVAGVSVGQGQNNPASGGGHGGGSNT